MSSHSTHQTFVGRLHSTSDLVGMQECGAINAYHRFEYPRKVMSKNRSSFMSSEIWKGMIDMVMKMAQSQVVMSRKSDTPKDKMMCRGIERDPRRLKARGRIPPFEAMLSLE